VRAYRNCLDKESRDSSAGVVGGWVVEKTSVPMAIFGGGILACDAVDVELILGGGRRDTGSCRDVLDFRRY
jgi:hypothetical protein